MKHCYIITLSLTFMLTNSCKTQNVVNLPSSDSDLQWETNEREYMSTIWNNMVVTNVSQPTLTAFRPENPNGTAVIICPGGGLYALSIESEGRQVAKWLNEKGITAFVLKYRLVPTGLDGTSDIMNDGAEVLTKAGKVLPMAVQDGLDAIAHVRSNAEKYNIDKQKIGIIGFSAGGSVTMGVTYAAEGDSRPDFIGPIYAWMDVVPKQGPPENPPPLFAACSTDDPLGLAAASVKIYQEWIEAKVPSELHMYAKGGHGYGMKKQDLPSDNWIDHFYQWMLSEGITK